MNWLITLRSPHTEGTVVVKKAILQDCVILSGTHPQAYPDGLGRGIRYMSTDRVAWIPEGSDVEVLSVAPTEEPVREPEAVT